MFAAISVLFNVLWVSAGATRLVTLPALRLNFGQSVVHIGGAITLFVLIVGAIALNYLAEEIIGALTVASPS